MSQINPFDNFSETEKFMLWRMIKAYNEKITQTVIELTDIKPAVQAFPTMLETASKLLDAGKKLQSNVENSISDAEQLKSFNTKTMFEMLNAIV